MPTVRQNAVGTGAVMINKILGIRRLAWRVQPPKQWKKRKREAAGGFADVLRETMRNGTGPGERPARTQENE